ncbi:MAG: hypothetical protein ACRD25_13190, partial [Terracidiphilus sp.]
MTISKRLSMGSAWAKSTPYFLDLDTDNQVAAAVPLLALAASKFHAKTSPETFLFPSEIGAREMF